MDLTPITIQEREEVVEHSPNVAETVIVPEQTGVFATRRHRKVRGDWRQFLVRQQRVKLGSPSGPRREIFRPERFLID